MRVNYQISTPSSLLPTIMLRDSFSVISLPLLSLVLSFMKVLILLDELRNELIEQILSYFNKALEIYIRLNCLSECR